MWKLLISDHEPAAVKREELTELRSDHTLSRFPKFLAQDKPTSWIDEAIKLSKINKQKEIPVAGTIIKHGMLLCHF